MKHTRREFILGSAAAAAAAAFGLARCGKKPQPDSSAPNILLIVLDTVRADRIGCYGAQRATSPALDDFARRATRYTRAFAPAPWTVPSHASMFCGLYPFMHGAIAYKTMSAENKAQAKIRPLAESYVTLAEMLKAEGFVTGSVCANTNFKGRQLLQGFDDPYIAHMYADEANEHIFSWLRGKARPPFFFFINYVDAHRPYNTREVPGFIGEPVSQDKRLIVQLMDRVLGTNDPLPQDLIARVLDQYDTGVRNVDNGMKSLLDELIRLGMYDDTLIIVTSDHGECFGEHRLVEHCLDVYQSEVHVPLLVKAPGQTSPASIDAALSLTHVPRMILETLPDPIRVRLTPRFPFAPDDPFLLCENQLMGDRKREFNAGKYGGRFDRTRRAVVEWPLKYVESTKDAPELYHLENDPGELENLAPGNPEHVKQLAEKLAVFAASHKAAANADDAESGRGLSEKDEQELDAMGYL